MTVKWPATECGKGESSASSFGPPRAVKSETFRLVHGARSRERGKEDHLHSQSLVHKLQRYDLRQSFTMSRSFLASFQSCCAIAQRCLQPICGAVTSVVVCEKCTKVHDQHACLRVRSRVWTCIGRQRADTERIERNAKVVMR